MDKSIHVMANKEITRKKRTEKTEKRKVWQRTKERRETGEEDDDLGQASKLRRRWSMTARESLDWFQGLHSALYIIVIPPTLSFSFLIPLEMTARTW